MNKTIGGQVYTKEAYSIINKFVARNATHTHTHTHTMQNIRNTFQLFIHLL